VRLYFLSWRPAPVVWMHPVAGTVAAQPLPAGGIGPAWSPGPPPGRRGEADAGNLGEALRHHFVGVLTEFGGGEDALQFAAHQGLVGGVVAVP
jgi:hypothetical protein